MLDGDLAHKEAAKGYLERIRNGPEFVGTAFQDDVLARLNEFDRLWRPLVLVDPPAEPPAEPATKPVTLGDVVTPPADADPPADDSDPEEVPGDTDAAPKAEPSQEPSKAEEPSDAGEAGPTRSAGGGDAEPKETPPNPSEPP